MLCIDFNAIFIWPGWGGIAAIGTLIAASIAVWYTNITRNILKTTGESIEGQRKLAEFEIYMQIAEKIDSDIGFRTLNDIVNSKLDLNDINSTEIALRTIFPFGDLGNFYAGGLINLETIENGFGAAILDLGNSLYFVITINNLRIKSPNTFKNFETLYIQLRNKLPPDLKLNYRENFNP